MIFYLLCRTFSRQAEQSKAQETLSVVAKPDVAYFSVVLRTAAKVEASGMAIAETIGSEAGFKPSIFRNHFYLFVAGSEDIAVFGQQSC